MPIPKKNAGPVISSGNLAAGEAGEMLGSNGVSAYLMFHADI